MFKHDDGRVVGQRMKNLDDGAASVPGVTKVHLEVAFRHVAGQLAHVDTGHGDWRHGSQINGRSVSCGVNSLTE